ALMGSGSADGFLVGDLGRCRLFRRGLEHAALGPPAPLDEAVLELPRGEPRRLQDLFGLDLGPCPAHELFGTPGEQEHHPKLAVDTFGDLLDHEFSHSSVSVRIGLSFNRFTGTRGGADRGVPPAGPRSVAWPELSILAQAWPDRAHHLR